MNDQDPRVGHVLGPPQRIAALLLRFRGWLRQAPVALEVAPTPAPDETTAAPALVVGDLARSCRFYEALYRAVNLPLTVRLRDADTATLLFAGRVVLVLRQDASDARGASRLPSLADAGLPASRVLRDTGKGGGGDGSAGSDAARQRGRDWERTPPLSTTDATTAVSAAYVALASPEPLESLLASLRAEEIAVTRHGEEATRAQVRVLEPSERSVAVVVQPVPPTLAGRQMLVTHDPDGTRIVITAALQTSYTKA